MKNINSDLEIIENKIDWNLIKFRKRKLRELTKEHNKNIIALDTETLNGYCKLICDSDKQYLLNPSIDEILEYMSKRKFEMAYNFFFNLNYDINSIIKMLPKENIIELKENNQTIYKKYSLFYIPKKLFTIKKGYNKRTKNNKTAFSFSHVISYFDIMQFYKGSLEKTAKKYLDLEKYTGNFEKIDGEILGTSKEYWDENLNIIIEYCINDCILTLELCKLLHKKTFEVMNFHPDKYTSEASITQYYIRRNVKLPNINKIPNESLKFAFNTYTGGRFEIIKKGNIGNCSLFDIKSAYPYYMRSLLDINQGKWKKAYSLNENADYGYYLVKLHTKYNKISPISYYLPNGVLTYPIIDCIKYMTKNELLNYEKYIEYEIIEGWEFYADKYVYPFKNYINNIYKEKTRISCLFYYSDNCKDNCNYCSNHLSYKKIANEELDFNYNLYKILMNSGYGKFYEKNKKVNPIYKKAFDESITKDIKLKTILTKYKNPEPYYWFTGKLFNPIFATEITSNTQIQIFNYAQKDIKNVVGFATDSILFKGNPDLPIGNRLGEWDKEMSGKGLVLKSGIYKINEKIQSRGIKKNENLNTPYGQYKDIIDYIKNKPELLKYPIIMKNPLSFKKVIQCKNKYNIEDINMFIPEIYEIDINKDYKRIWDKKFSNGLELLNTCISSNPLVIA